MGLSLQMLLQFFTNIRQETWNASPSWTTAENSRVLLSAALPLKQSPSTESRHQSGRQSAYNLSHIHWPTKSHRFTVLVFLKHDVSQWIILFFYVFSSLPNPWYFFYPSTKWFCPTCSTGHWDVLWLSSTSTCHHSLHKCYRVSFRRLSEWRACTFFRIYSNSTSHKHIL